GRWVGARHAGTTTTDGAGMSSQKGNRQPEGRRSHLILNDPSLDGIADRAQDLADLAAQEDEGDDRDDGDEREDQRVLGETLALLVLREAGDERVDVGHSGEPPDSSGPKTAGLP